MQPGVQWKRHVRNLEAVVEAFLGARIAELTVQGLLFWVFDSGLGFKVLILVSL